MTALEKYSNELRLIFQKQQKQQALLLKEQQTLEKQKNYILIQAHKEQQGILKEQQLQRINQTLLKYHDELRTMITE